MHEGTRDVLPVVVGAGFAGLITLLGFLGKGILNAFASIREDIGELRVDVAVLFDRSGVRHPSHVEREKIRDELVSR